MSLSHQEEQRKRKEHQSIIFELESMKRDVTNRYRIHFKQ